MPAQNKTAVNNPTAMNKWVYLAIGMVLGLLLLGAWRFVSWQDNSTHYHANFALYFNGVREPFLNPLYYEEVTMCTSDYSNLPTVRAHMHDSVSDVVHVEDTAVTWGQFFENLGFSIGAKHLQTPSDLYTESAKNRVSFILNGQPIDNVSGMVIKSRDRLLINYGPELAEAILARYETVPSSAEDYNRRADPGACGGQLHNPWLERLRHIIF